MFEVLDKAVLRPLPEHRYQYGEWIKARVHIDYHVQVEGHYYSVPYKLLKKQLDDDPAMGYAVQTLISRIYFKRYLDTAQKLQAIVQAMPIEAI